MKHVQWTSFGNGFMCISGDLENYKNEINKMHTTKEIKKELCLIINLKPYVDDQGILRINGWLENVNSHSKYDNQ